MIRFTSMLAVALSVCIPLSTSFGQDKSERPQSRPEAVSLVRNGAFSIVKNDKPEGWQIAGDEHVTQRLDVEMVGGNPCAKLTCTRCEGKSGASHAMLAQVGLVSLEKGKVYEFSCRARAEGLAGGNVNVAINDTRSWESCGLQAGLPVTPAWQEFRRVFRATASVSQTSRLQFWFNEPGTFYLDEVRLLEVAGQPIEFTDTIVPAGGRNLVPNGSFELGAAGWSSLGRKVGWGCLAGLHGNVQTSGGTSGASFLRISLGGGRTPVLYFDYFKPTVHHERQPLAAHVGWIPVEKGLAYTISCDMRASPSGVKAILGVRSQDPEGSPKDLRQQVTLSDSWKRCAFTFRPPYRFVFATIGPDVSEERDVSVDIDAIQLEKGERATSFQPRAAVEAALDPPGNSGICEQGECIALRLRGYNDSPSPADVKVSFEVRDFFDRPITLPAESLAVPAGSAAEREIRLPAEWRGYCRILARFDLEGRIESRSLSLATVPRRTTSDTVLGINHAFASADLIRLAGMAGVSWYRDWSLKWQDIEPSPGDFHWQAADAQLDRVLGAGAQVLPLLPPFPSTRWSSEAPADLPVEGYPGVRLRQSWGPKEPRHLADFAEKTVGRYRDRIHVWEFLNEPIYTDYALPGQRIQGYPGKRYTPADYVGLLKATAAAMRRGDPGCRVIGGIAGPPGLMTREVIEAGCLKYVDIFNLHAYPGRGRPEGFIAEMDALAALMDQHGGRKPIWITEVSYYAVDDLPWRPFFENGWSWVSPLASERQCAEYTIRLFTIMLGRGVKKLFLHSGANEAVNEWGFECCLFSRGGAPRKVFPALAVFTDLLGPEPVFAGDKNLPGSDHCYAFESPGRSVLVLWREHESPHGTITIPAGARCLDLMGNPAATISVLPTPSPVYLVGSPGRAKLLLDSLGG
ncbi:MAG TPA: hypothetical protein PKY77_05450 [Phycisphaerae bacterium]|nr:hypothetical protein [Phycisphaerae bacterium]HRY68959.1 hypothetical protein [Phycisphaerae bacterium]HSA25786.1 hypothetical protein [Phycisphaerae bacterium]